MIRPTPTTLGRETTGTMWPSIPSIAWWSAWCRASGRSRGAFRTLRLARDFVEIGLGFWLMGVSLVKFSEVRQWNAI